MTFSVKVGPVVCPQLHNKAREKDGVPVLRFMLKIIVKESLCIDEDLRTIEGRRHALGHTAGQWWSLPLTPGSL